MTDTVVTVKCSRCAESWLIQILDGDTAYLVNRDGTLHLTLPTTGVMVACLCGQP